MRRMYGHIHFVSMNGQLHNSTNNLTENPFWQKVSFVRMIYHRQSNGQMEEMKDVDTYGIYGI
jgi:hypothetical protein